MKTRTLVLTGLILGAGATCMFLVHRNRALLRDVVQLREQIILLETMQTENAELRVRLSRKQAAEWELETLRQQARDVHRLRAQGSELLRLRGENQEMTLQVGRLTNHLDQLARQNEELRVAAKTPLGGRVVMHGDAVTIPMVQTHWAEADSDTVSNIRFKRFLDRDAVTSPGVAPPSSDVRLPPPHSESNQSCVSCHEPAKPQGEVKPQLLGLIDFQTRSK